MSTSPELTPSAEIHEVPAQKCEDHVAELQELVGHLSDAGSSSTTAIVHEIAQPVTAAAHYLVAAEQILLNESDGAETAGIKAVQFAQECLTRTGEVMAAIRDGDGKDFEPSPHELAHIVVAALQMLAAETAPIESIEISTAACWVMCDEVQLGQVVCNLVRNAVEATEGQPARHLRVASRPIDGNFVELRIEDNGPGIAEGVKGHLFTTFCSTKKGGEGVGLSICRAIVERHGGDIWAEELPEGTAFCFTVPSCAAGGQKAGAPPGWGIVAPDGAAQA